MVFNPNSPLSSTRTMFRIRSFLLVLPSSLLSWENRTQVFITNGKKTCDVLTRWTSRYNTITACDVLSLNCVVEKRYIIRSQDATSVQVRIHIVIGHDSNCWTRRTTCVLCFRVRVHNGDRERSTNDKQTDGPARFETQIE